MQLMQKKPLSLNYLVGIDIPEHIKEEINEFLLKKLGDYKPVLNMFSLFEYHMTIAYLGKITEEQRLRLIAASDTISFSPFSMSVQGIGLFPPGKKPKNIWIGISAGRDVINVFAQRIREEITLKSGLIAKNSFYPHITVAKIKENSTIDYKNMFNIIADNWNYPFGSFKVSSFHLFRINENRYIYNHEVKLSNHNNSILQ